MPTQSAKQDLDALTAKFFAAFATQGGEKVDLGPLRELFVPTAIITRTCANDFETYDLDSFIAPREAILNSGDLVDFSEHEVHETTQIFGDIAQRWTVYHKQGVLRGEDYRGSGVKSLQFVKTPAGWRFSAVAWDDARDDLPLPHVGS